MYDHCDGPGQVFVAVTSVLIGRGRFEPDGAPELDAWGFDAGVVGAVLFDMANWFDAAGSTTYASSGMIPRLLGEVVASGV